MNCPGTAAGSRQSPRTPSPVGNTMASMLCGSAIWPKSRAGQTPGGPPTSRPVKRAGRSGRGKKPAMWSIGPIMIRKRKSCCPGRTPGRSFGRTRHTPRRICSCPAGSLRCSTALRSTASRNCPRAGERTLEPFGSSGIPSSPTWASATGSRARVPIIALAATP